MLDQINVALETSFNNIKHISDPKLLNNDVHLVYICALIPHFIGLFEGNLLNTSTKKNHKKNPRWWKDIEQKWLQKLWISKKTPLHLFVDSSCLDILHLMQWSWDISKCDPCVQIVFESTVEHYICSYPQNWTSTAVIRCVWPLLPPWGKVLRPMKTTSSLWH